MASSHGISLDLPDGQHPVRPANVTHLSSPAYNSPLRHHRRQPSTPHQVKETLHARSEYTNSEDDGTAIHRINQYIIKQEIGRGSFGAVHLAVDQYGNEYAVKEFSKSRLRKRAQSNILRRPHGPRRPGHLAAGLSFNSPMHHHSASDIHDAEEGGNALYLIREEIAIMKKLNHDNLVTLIEVLDDPNEDSLYMVMEICKKGVVMKVEVRDRADPYDEESCRCWFRDLILGIEYLHAQGIVHRDIKPDNCLLTDDDVLKVVDFGVSEMFEKHAEMRTVKSAGSPAFLPPELCVANHGGISGKAADIWSMGVTLYCLRFGKVPFERLGVLDLYESIKKDELELESDCDEDFKDLMHRILEKDPSARIQMPKLRVHPWVTKRGTDPLLSEDENTADLIDPPTEEEMNRAITINMSSLLVMKAVKKFKNLITRRRPYLDSILGQETRIVRPPLSINSGSTANQRHKTHSLDTYDRRPLEQALVREGVHRKIDPENLEGGPPDREDGAVVASPETTRFSIHDAGHTHARPRHRSPAGGSRSWDLEHAHDVPKGHAHDPLDYYLFLAVGPSGNDSPPDPPAVSESPPAAEGNIYEKAYYEEVERIRAQQGQDTTLYLTRRVGGKAEPADDGHLISGEGRSTDGVSQLARLLHRVQAHE